MKNKFALLLLCLAVPLHAQDFSRPEVSNLTTELVMELHVQIAAPVAIGDSDLGNRRYIPITGGSFEGKGIKGEVLAGGADWQLERPDGVLEIHAIYSIRTDDGAVIAVDNQGIAINLPIEGSPETERYTRTTPEFSAPIGKYDWLNKRVFTGTITPVLSEGKVVIRVFEVQ